ncbi:Cof-type HAD-IIB family hydrolase [Anaerobium acetethylicum]|uniref:Cof subfamily of IIB subfamily of haloacid dehalogenase superfamily/HAD-superfamily hydrolase, subfamily IIB n=1 Tax=Anaerobium acetethylicum TaxID=1619234 RepID=A0A1D3TRS5_9FIRM|nr:Cof-type HAD-IIB family hydrolase [Anaerobium acetethylicum]SCP96469.1 hypothetical protein SAMN05421730_10052 [Anaerobium acetethylicum]
MSRKAVFFDIDGTLYDDKLGIIDSTRKAIRQLVENGHLAFVCTGRSKALVPEEDFLPIGFNGIVAACGTYIDYEGTNVYNRELDPKLVRDSVEILRKHKLIPVLEGAEYIYFDKEEYTEEIDPFAGAMEASIGDRRKPIKGNEDSVKINKFTVKRRPDSAIEEACRELASDFEPIFHDSHSIEFVPKSFSKARGIEIITEKLGISRENTYAFGDSNNDMEMIKYVQYGIAMGNSTDAILKAADYITDDIRDHGIMNGLKHFGLI